MSRSVAVKTVTQRDFYFEIITCRSIKNKSLILNRFFFNPTVEKKPVLFKKKFYEKRKIESKSAAIIEKYECTL